MADDARKRPVDDSVTKKSEDAAEATTTKRGLLMKYLLFGGIGLVAVVAITVALAVLLGGDETASPEALEARSDEPAADLSAAADSQDSAGDREPDSLAGFEDDLDFLIDENDPELMELIQSSLEYLDYEPEPTASAEEETEDIAGMSREDSVEFMEWLEEEKAALSARESELRKRREELETLDEELSRKMAVIEKAESTRITQLAKLYNGMDARAVAQLMANLDDLTVVSILPRMKQQNAARVLQMIPAKRAARLSKKMMMIAEN
jgi:flagellar motility protein MotE (MotC chaperone)